MPIVILSIFFILYLFAKYRVFEKAGEKGWKALIPFLNKYLLFKRTWKQEWFTIYLLCLVLFIVCVSGMFMNIGPTQLLYAISLTSYIFLILIFLSLNYHLSKYFKLNTFYTIGMVVLYPVFILLLAFKKS